jgi:hypothetical protein
MGACVFPSQAFVGVWPTFVISLAAALGGANRKGLSLGDLSLVLWSLFHEPFPPPHASG